VEVLVALALLASVALTSLALSTRTARAVVSLRQLTSTTVAAVQRVEQLRALTWAVHGDGTSVTDLQAAVDGIVPALGGVGIAVTPPGTLDTSELHFADYLDARGQWAGNGASPLATAAFTRRWSVAPLPGGDGRTLVVRVFAMTSTGPQTRSGLAGRVIAFSDASLIEIRTRVLR
jgi:hypothetical protein